MRQIVDDAEHRRGLLPSDITRDAEVAWTAIARFSDAVDAIR